ncbi:hypothetical protein ALC56_03026, partial [Trachymyrmex septentrionalis]
EAVHCAAYLLNQTVNQDEKTLFELWFKRKPNLYRIKIFGSSAFINILKIQRKKKECARRMVLVGYQESKKLLTLRY